MATEAHAASELPAAPVPPQRFQMTTGKIILAVVVGVVLAVMIVRGVLGATGSHLDPNQQSSQQFQVVPCATHPEAIGCGGGAASATPQVGDPSYVNPCAGKSSDPSYAGTPEY